MGPLSTKVRPFYGYPQMKGLFPVLVVSQPSYVPLFVELVDDNDF